MWPSVGVFELIGEEGGGGLVEAGGLAAVEFGADGVEIHEPALEQRPRHRLQRRVHPPVQLDLVVQRPKHRRDGFLLGEGRKREPEVSVIVMLTIIAAIDPCVFTRARS